MRKPYTLVGVNGNAYAVMGYVIEAMRDCFRETKFVQFDRAHQKEFQDDAMKSDYNNLLCVSIKMVDWVNEAMKLEPTLDDPDEYDLECQFCGKLCNTNEPVRILHGGRICSQCQENEDE